MSHIQSPSQSADIPTAFPEPAFRLGWLLADEALGHLQERGIPAGKHRHRKNLALAYPEILMELAAVLPLIAWQRGELFGLLEDDVATLASALDDARRGVTAVPSDVSEPDRLPALTEGVFRIWERRLSWSALSELSADVLLDVSPSDEECLLEELADLLWKRRDSGAPHTRS
jgi:hypothetical protein